MGELISGADQLAALSRRLTEAGAGELQAELSGRISAAARPVLTEIRGGLPRYMPNRYAGVLAADLQLRTDKLAGGGIRIRAVAPTGGGGRRVARLDTGILEHPLYRNRTYWYSQGPFGGGMVPGWFSTPAFRSAPRMREAILTAMRAIADKITRG